MHQYDKIYQCYLYNFRNILPRVLKKTLCLLTILVNISGHYATSLSIIRIHGFITIGDLCVFQIESSISLMHEAIRNDDRLLRERYKEALRCC